MAVHCKKKFILVYNIIFNVHYNYIKHILYIGFYITSTNNGIGFNFYISVKAISTRAYHYNIKIGSTLHGESTSITYWVV